MSSLGMNPGPGSKTTSSVTVVPLKITSFLGSQRDQIVAIHTAYGI